MSESEVAWRDGWHYSAADGSQEGPISAERLVKLHLAKKVRPDDQVWHPGLDDWCTLREAWPNLRPFKQALTSSRKSGGGGASSRGRARDYSVVEIVGSLSGEEVERALKARVHDGWTYDSAIVVDPSRCLLVFRK